MGMLDKINNLGKNLNRILFADVNTATRLTTNSEFEQHHRTIAGINHFITNWRGVTTILMIVCMVLALYLIWSYDNDTFRSSYFFFPIDQYCAQHPNATGYWRSSQYTTTQCYNPMPNLHTQPINFTIPSSFARNSSASKGS